MVSDSKHGEALLARLKQARDDDAALDLLGEFQSGFSIERLRELLTGQAADTVRSGVWIASELGRAVRPVLDDIAPLLRHSDRYVRFFGLDCVLAAAGEGDGSLLGTAAALLSDADAAVRWKAMNFLASASQTQLLAAADHVASKELEDRLRWLGQVGVLGSAAVHAKLGSRDAGDQMIAAIAAARLAGDDVSVLQMAADSEIAEIKAFAVERLDRLHGDGSSKGGPF